MANAFYKPSGDPAQASRGQSKKIRDEFEEVEDGFDILNTEYFLLSFHNLNANARGRSFISPIAGDISKVDVVSDAANGGSDTVLSLEIGGVAVSSSTMTIAAADGIGNEETATPSANKTVAVGDRVEVLCDGAGSTVMPGSVIVHIARTAIA